MQLRIVSGYSWTAANLEMGHHVKGLAMRDYLSLGIIRREKISSEASKDEN